MNTPWGKADQKEVIADGIVFYSTPSHGGIKVSKEWTKLMPSNLINASGWYEEDCEILKVIVAFPSFFPNQDLELAKQQLNHWFKIEA